jgi:predicted XRE-type DNA-binding protein
MGDDYRVSSGNVFADLGFPDAEELNTKAELAIKISQTIQQRKMTQVQAAAALGVDQPKISAVVRGRLDQFSVERLCDFLIRLGYDVDINVREHKDKEGPAQFTVTTD